MGEPCRPIPASDPPRLTRTVPSHPTTWDPLAPSNVPEGPAFPFAPVLRHVTAVTARYPTQPRTKTAERTHRPLQLPATKCYAMQPRATHHENCQTNPPRR